MTKRRLAYALVLFVVAYGPARLPAEVSRRESEDGSGQTLVSLTVTPAAPKPPVLRHLLLPPLADRRSGNAAVMYNKAALIFGEKSASEFGAKEGDWSELSLERLPIAEIEQELAARQATLELLDLAARREQCDWELPFHDRVNLIQLLLPEVQKMRAYARLVATRARVQIAAGKFDDATRSLQTLFRMAQHTAAEQTLINGLVGVAISGVAINSAVDDWIGKSGSPNLYWPLASLPRPLFSILRSLESERDWLYLSYPILKELRIRACSIDEINSAYDALARDLNLAAGGQSDLSRVAAMGLVAVNYPRCKQRLLEQGVPATLVEAMPAGQVVLADAMRRYDELRDAIFSWMGLPCWQAEAGMMAAEQALVNQGVEREVLPIARMLLPAISSASQAFARIDRQVAQRMVIEALRAYAATHDGKLPDKLADIVELPIPRDPLTDQPFEYQLFGDVATLKSPIRPGGKPVAGNHDFEIRIAR